MRGAAAPLRSLTWEILAAKALEKRRREIALREGWNDDGDVLAGILFALADLDSGKQGRAGGNPDRHPFETGNVPRCFDRFGAGDRDDLVIDLGVEDSRCKARPN